MTKATEAAGELLERMDVTLRGYEPELVLDRVFPQEESDLSCGDEWVSRLHSSSVQTNVGTINRRLPKTEADPQFQATPWANLNNVEVGSLLKAVVTGLVAIGVIKRLRK